MNEISQNQNLCLFSYFFYFEELTSILKVLLIDQDYKNLLRLFVLLCSAYFLFQTELCVLVDQIETFHLSKKTVMQYLKDASADLSIVSFKRVSLG